MIQSPDEKLKEFKFDPSKGVRQNTDLIPPPYFARTHVPFNYKCVVPKR
jgi:general transcription factor 3C polypeptide 5 (transcription factor C subunit 1)